VQQRRARAQQQQQQQQQQRGAVHCAATADQAAATSSAPRPPSSSATAELDAQPDPPVEHAPQPHVLAPPPAAAALQAALADFEDLQHGAPPTPADVDAAAGALAAAEAAAAELPPPVPTDVLLEFEQKLEADVSSVFLTLAAVTGVICYWRGVWSLLDYFMGDSVLGDVCCMIVGLTIVLWIRLSGAKVATSFWPPG